MAAKPPKPPGNFLKQLNDCLSNTTKNNNNNNKSVKSINKTNVPPVLSKLKKDDNIKSKGCPIVSVNAKLLENCINTNNIETSDLQSPSANVTPAEASNHTSTSTPTSSPITAQDSTSTSKSNCNCTNISIMHLFHEMKQEFPTIPDTIVAQCVNENCHQRENCIQQLRNELALNPIPVQSYPTKVLHPPQKQYYNSVPKALVTTPNIINSNTSVSSPLKPFRPAPVQPPYNSSKPKPFALQFPTNISEKKVNCDSISSATNINNNNICNKNTNPLHHCNNYNSCEKDVKNNFQDCESAKTNTTNTSDMPTTTKSLTFDNDYISETRSTVLTENRENVSPNQVPLPTNAAPLPPRSLAPRTRPTTLNLQTEFQHQQRQQINIQLEKHFEQRNQQHQHQHQQQSLQQSKPLRKAPLPPLPPKPIQIANAGAHSPQFHHQQNVNKSNHNNNNINVNQNSNHNNVSNNNTLTHSQQSSFSNDSSLTSPATSIGEPEISVNVSLSSPSVAYQSVTPHTPTATATGTTTPSSSLKSPIRHRSVITVHPEPPYTKDFLNSAVTGVTPTTTGIGATGQKSFTSVNLTLRQPNTNSSIPASTIDISAGPGLSGNSSGLTYSSTSYDARRGYQKNFHITVTDQGGVFSASHIRPRSCYYPGGDYENDSPNAPISGNNNNLLRAASSEQCVAQQFQQNNTFQQQQQQQNIVASINNSEMCAPKDLDVLTETLGRQKNRRNKLATALRDNKKRLHQVEEEINVLIDPISPGVTERLDDEIQRLRSDCESMLNEIDVARRNAVVPSLPSYNNENSNNRQQPQTQPQPFPRQRQHRTSSSSSRPSPSTTSPHQPQLDFIQHHINPTIIANPSMPPNMMFISPNHQTTPTYQEYCQQYQQAQNMPSTDEEDYTDSLTDADDDEEPWVCSMCTFRNHPQLNICECCENVRILPEPLLSREDIHITLSPGENRIIHSWVVS